MGMGQWAAYLITAMKRIDILEARISHLETLENPVGVGHDHDGGDGGLIPEAGLTSGVTNQLVTGGDVHDHEGGDGGLIPENGLQSAVKNQLVTGGDGHNHEGGDGAIIDTGALASKAVTTAKIDDLAVDTGQLVAKAVTADKIDDLAVDTGQLVAKAITAAKIDDLAVDTGQIANLAVETAKINNNAVDDTKVGNRVPQLTRREGGNSGHWATTGTTGYTPGEVKMQCGAILWTGSAYGGSKTVSYPQSFGGTAMVLVTHGAWSGNAHFEVWVSGEGSSGCTLNFAAGNNQTAVEFYWLAIGPA